jgi:hypothetical protein
MRFLFRNLACAVILAGFIAQPVSAADDFETYRQLQLQGMQTASEEFQQYKEKEDREFASFLKSRWREFKAHQGQVRIKEPKPREIPVVTPVSPIPGALPIRPLLGHCLASLQPSPFPSNLQ